jgi:hypothetical protein
LSVVLMSVMETPMVIVIAGPRVGAKCRPVTGSAKQSISPLPEMWIASSLCSSQK